MKNAYIVECFKNGSCKRRRSFTSPERAVDFANRWHDDHYDDEIWDVQIITPEGAIHQTNTNGNTAVESIR